MSDTQPDVIVVGAGVPGLLTALELTHAGREVLVVDRIGPGAEATGASAGILSPLPPWHYPPAMQQLSRWSQARWPAFLAELQLQSEIDFGYHAPGMLVLDEDPCAVEAWADSSGEPLRWLTPDALRAVEPLLAASAEDAIFLPDVGHVHAGRLAQALCDVLVARGGCCERLAVDALHLSDNAVTGVRSGKCVVHAETVILAAGAWTPALLEPLGLDLPVDPVKGQLLEYAAPSEPLRHVVLRGGRYLMPALSGGLIAGSTLEHSGFDKRTTESAREEIATAAAALAPELGTTTILGQWAGLRPGNHDGMPYLGPVDGVPGLHLCAGLYTNGICGALAAAQVVADAVLGRSGGLDPAPYLPARIWA